MNFLYFIFILVPKNVISAMVGWIAQLELPHPLSAMACKMFVLVFGINMSEAEFPVEQYKSIEDVFTRKLKPGLRPLAKSKMISPVDGIWMHSQNLNATGHAIQAKERTYSAESLVYGTENKDSKLISVSYYMGFYLAPHNYHRVHSPVNAKLQTIIHIPGTLWPVNPIFKALVPNLFIANERLTFLLELEGGGTVALVMVGALNVGKIETPFLPYFSTNSGETVLSSFKVEPAATIKAGDEIGTFMLGSTVILVLDELAKNKLNPNDNVRDDVPVKMGEAISSG